MASPPPPPSATLVALLVLGGLGHGLVIVATTWGWTLFVPGLIALLVALPLIWSIQKS